MNEEEFFDALEYAYKNEEVWGVRGMNWVEWGSPRGPYLLCCLWDLYFVK